MSGIQESSIEKFCSGATTGEEVSPWLFSASILHSSIRYEDLRYIGPAEALG